LEDIVERPNRLAHGIWKNYTNERLRAGNGLAMPEYFRFKSKDSLKTVCGAVLCPQAQRLLNLPVYNWRTMKTQKCIPYVWDYDLDESQFRDILEGRRVMGRLDSDWAARRLLDYTPYEKIFRLLGFRRLVENWPRWRPGVRSKSRIRGFGFLVAWLPAKHPEVLDG
jgi:hypothetical protein